MKRALALGLSFSLGLTPGLAAAAGNRELPPVAGVPEVAATEVKAPELSASAELLKTPAAIPGLIPNAAFDRPAGNERPAAAVERPAAIESLRAAESARPERAGSAGVAPERAAAAVFDGSKAPPVEAATEAAWSADAASKPSLSRRDTPAERRNFLLATSLVMAGTVGLGFADPQTYSKLPLPAMIYAFFSYAVRAFAKREPAGFFAASARRGLAEMASVLFLTAPFLFLSLLGSGEPVNWGTAAGLGLMWGLGTSAFIHDIAAQRREVGATWQASHDQKYRVGPDGKLRDVRGRRYGQDRHEEYVPGTVSPLEVYLARSWAAAAGSVPFLARGADLTALLAYNLVLASFFLAADLRSRPRPSA